MPSTESAALAALLHSMGTRIAENPGMGLDGLRAMTDELQELTGEPKDVAYEDTSAGGCPALWAIPQNAIGDAAILYFHGGAYIANSMRTHRKLAGHLANASAARVLVTDFRLAPEHPFPAQLDDAVAAYRWLRRDRTYRRVGLAGDSGGAGLAVLTALRLRADGDTAPDAIAGFSPWLDLAAEFGETYTTNAEHDAFINPTVLRNFSAMFLGDNGDPRNPAANPYYADLTGLPPTWFSVGGHEALLGSVEEFAARARAADAWTTVVVTPQMQHVFAWMAGNAPEADEAIRAAGAFLAGHLTS